MVKNIGTDFIEMTKYQNLEETGEDKGRPEPPVEKEIPEDVQLIDLPNPEPSKSSGSVSVLDAMNNRKSVRKYHNTPLSLKELSILLWNTQGIKGTSSTRSVTKRTVPSAGARHAFETYLLVNRVSDLNPGLYKYVAKEHKLVNWTKNRIRSTDLTKACLGQDFTDKSALTFIWTAVANRMIWRYGERGYRYLFLDAGHVCQNLYITAESLGCGVCAVGAFNDDEINDILAVDGKREFVIYLASVGRKIVR